MTIMRVWVAILVLLAASSLATFAGKEESLDQLIARAEAARLQDRPSLYLQIARRQGEAADKHYEDGDAEAGNSALNDMVTYSDKATDAAVRSGKRLKDTEIALRKMAEKFRDIKRTLPFEDQAPVQQAIDHLEKLRTDLLTAMFGKKEKK
jgi:hypothetical protein